jgi:hypothetical protein
LSYLGWFDDEVEDLNESFGQLSGVSFSSGVTYVVDERAKRTYNAEFKANFGKFE